MTEQHGTGKERRKFGALSTTANLFLALGVVTGGVGGMFALQGLESDSLWAGGLLVLTAFWVLVCFAIGDGIKVVLAIEENTRPPHVE